MAQCPKCGWTIEKGSARFCPRCGTALSDDGEGVSHISPPVPPIYLELRLKFFTPLFLLSVALLIAGAVAAGTGDDSLLGWVFVAVGLPLLLISVLRRKRR